MKRFLIIAFFITLAICNFAKGETKAATTKKPFIVVIDAGHGGKDDGAKGKHHLKEKDINLSVALKLGQMINTLKGVRVYYTRKTDVFVPLADRAQYANRLNADLFISIHTNSAETRKAHGTEVYSFSPSSSSVAMRENSVMEMEDNYRKKYDGFNPRSTESYIQWDLVAGDFGYSGQSKKFAGRISSQLKKYCSLESRGVREAGFWVLKYCKMPGVLVEVGYVSNIEEEKYLRKDASRVNLARSVYKAFVQYKADYDKKTSADALAANKKSTTEKSHVLTSGVHYRVQFYKGERKSMYAKEFKHCVPAKEYPIGGGGFIYMYGDETSLEGANRLLKKVKKDFKRAYLVVFKNGHRLTENDAAKYLH